MAQDAIATLFTGGMGLVVVPWCIFVTVSIFNQRQEIALLRQIVSDLKTLLQNHPHSN